MSDTKNMLIWKERLDACPIMSLQTGAQLGVVDKPILDPRELKIVAFYVSGPHIEQQPAILHADDVREFGSLGMIVNDSENIMALDPELVRLQEILSYNFELIGMRVIDTAQKKLGKVADYVVDSTDFSILKFNVKAPMLHVGGAGDLLISRQQIREINDDHIVVAAPTVDAPGAEHPQLPAFENPFRRPHPEGNQAAHQKQ